MRKGATVVAIVVVLVAAAWWLFPSVPNVVGMDYEAAVGVLEDAGFEGREGSQANVYSSRHRWGQIKCTRNGAVIYQRVSVGALGHALRGSAITVQACFWGAFV